MARNYFKYQHLMTKQGELVLPNVYNTNSIYEQTTLGYDWSKGKTKTSEKGLSILEDMRVEAVYRR